MAKECLVKTISGDFIKLIDKEEEVVSFSIDSIYGYSYTGHLDNTAINQIIEFLTEDDIIFEDLIEEEPIEALKEEAIAAVSIFKSMGDETLSILFRDNCTIESLCKILALLENINTTTIEC